MKFRNEYKHYATNQDLIPLRKRLAAVMKRDRYTDSSGGYLIKSLYFDNCYDKALAEKLYGTEKREKFRIRYYNDNKDFIRLEKKSKIGGKCLKQGTRITEEQVRKILNDDIEWMIATQDELICELWSKMQYQMLRPKSIVVYDREAYVYEPGNVRVTIDSNIRGSNNVRGFLNEDTVMLQTFRPSILEVKWDEFLPQIVRDIVQLDDAKTSSFSKYAAIRLATI